MEPLNFEDTIREKLHNREISPSKEAWETLSHRLDEHESKTKPNFYWLAIAATLIALLVVASLVFNFTPQTPNKAPLVVEKTSDKNNDNLINEKEKEINTYDKDQVQIGVNKLKTNNNNITITKPLKKLIKTSNTTLVKTTDKKIESTQTSPTQTQVIATNYNQQTEENLLQNKIDEVVSKIETLQSRNNSVSVAEIDSLLKQAQREIQLKKVMQSKKVDANALLAEVEMDLYNGFRDKVFLVLGEGFEYVKEAVAKRSN